MSRHRTGFTLIELLVVMTVVAILVVLLMPSLSTAWQTAQMTRCKRNLNAQYSAQAVWRQDRETRGWDARLQGPGWRGELLPYVEGDRTVFICESRGLRSSNDPVEPTPTPPVTPPDPNPVTPPTPPPPPTPPTPPDPDDWNFSFNVYLQQGAIEGNTGVNGAGIAGPYGDFIRNIALGSSTFVRKTTYADHVRYEADDCGIGIVGDADITCDIYFTDGQPTKVVDVRGSGADTQSAKWRYIYDFLVGTEVYLTRWQTHYGETISLKKGSNPGEPGWRPGGGVMGDPSRESAPAPAMPLVGDYGLSRGTYEYFVGGNVNDATKYRTVQNLDAKLFFILDYPKAVADYTPGSNEPADWSTYFIIRPELWDDPSGGVYKKGPGAVAGRPWQFYQALRHFGGANMLFCDGHVETLQADDLRVDNPAWYHKAR